MCQLPVQWLTTETSSQDYCCAGVAAWTLLTSVTFQLLTFAELLLESLTQILLCQDSSGEFPHRRHQATLGWIGVHVCSPSSLLLPLWHQPGWCFDEEMELPPSSHRHAHLLSLWHRSDPATLDFPAEAVNTQSCCQHQHHCRPALTFPCSSCWCHEEALCQRRGRHPYHWEYERLLLQRLHAALLLVAKAAWVLSALSLCSSQHSFLSWRQPCSGNQQAPSLGQTCWRREA